LGDLISTIQAKRGTDEHTDKTNGNAPSKYRLQGSQLLRCTNKQKHGKQPNYLE
jgi:hypothetical protein